ncbi:MAG: DUF4058 family protein [Gemmataceae bacterium]|nr:DUF4058 family protein [Gemmataceae bacterium]
MPMHDWTRVKPNIYHDFHGGWIYATRGALNSGVLPPGYYALAEQITRTMGPDVLTLERPEPDEPGGGNRRPGSNGAMTVTATPPRTRFVVSEKPRPRRLDRRITIRHVGSHRMVAVIELVSPANKASKFKLRTFVDKAVGALDAGLHLLVIDPFPPGTRDPEGVHGAIWEVATGRPFTLPPGKPLTLASYSSGEELSAYVEPVAVGDPLPDMPLFLEPETYVNVPLEATYQAAWQTFPEPWKAAVAGG